MRNNFWGASGLQQLGCVGKEDLCLDQNLPRTWTQLAFQSFSVTSPMCTGCWAWNPVRCEEVVSLLYDKFSLAFFISGTPKLHLEFFLNTSSSVLPFFLVEGSKWFKILVHSMKLASFIILTPSLHQFLLKYSRSDYMTTQVKHPKVFPIRTPG